MSIIPFISLHLLLQSSPYGLACYPFYLPLQLSFQWQGMRYKLGRSCTYQSCSVLVAVVDSIESHWNLRLHNEWKSTSDLAFYLRSCSTPSQLVIGYGKKSRSKKGLKDLALLILKRLVWWGALQSGRIRFMIQKIPIDGVLKGALLICYFILEKSLSIDQ